MAVLKCQDIYKNSHIASHIKHKAKRKNNQQRCSTQTIKNSSLDDFIKNKVTPKNAMMPKIYGSPKSKRFSLKTNNKYNRVTNLWRCKIPRRKAISLDRQHIVIRQKLIIICRMD